MYHLRFAFRVSALALVVAAGSGCAGSLYELPAPPPASEQRSVSLVPGEEERMREEDYLLARASVLKINQLFAAKRFQEALQWMSAETRDFIAAGSPQKDPADVLASGRYIRPDGQVATIDPAAFLLARDLSKMQDSADGVEENETPRRKEIFAMEEGGPRRIILIKEGDRWVLHRTSFPTNPQ
jgi:hypothetical protein